MEENNNITENAQQYQKPNNGKAGIIIGVIAALAAVLVIGIAAVAIKGAGSKDPEDMFKAGMENISTEMIGYTASIAEKIDFKSLAQRNSEQPLHLNIDLSLTMPDVEELENVNIEIDGVSSSEDRQGQFNVKAGMSGFSMSIADVMLDDDLIYLSVPLLSDEVYSIDLTTLAEDYNNSAWRDIIGGETISDDYSLELFDMQSEEAELAKALIHRCEELKGTVQYGRLKEKKKLEAGGKTIECSGIMLTVAKDDINAFIENSKNDIMQSDYYLNTIKNAVSAYDEYDYSYEDYKDEIDSFMDELLGMKFDEDVVINVYFDKEGHIRQIMSDKTAMSDGPDHCEFSIDFMGVDRTLDSTKAKFGFGTDDGDGISIILDRMAEVTDEQYAQDISLGFYDNDVDKSENTDAVIEFNIQNKWNYTDDSFDVGVSIVSDGEDITLKADGAFTDVVKGEGYTVELDDLALSFDGEDLLLMTGSVMTEPFDGKIEIPENAVDLFDMTQEDIYGLIYDLGDTYYY